MQCGAEWRSAQSHPFLMKTTFKVPFTIFRRVVLRSLLLVLATVLLGSCVGDGGGGPGVGRMNSMDQRIFDERQARINAEPLGDYWIGRRWWTKGTRFWGYVRRPRQPWTDAKLVMMYEGFKRTPDRLPEEATSGRVHGFDHNYEYRIYGNFSGGAPIYDPNSDMILPEFILRDYELISANPGFLFRPDERYLSTALPPIYPGRGQEVAR